MRGGWRLGKIGLKKVFQVGNDEKKFERYLSRYMRVGKLRMKNKFLKKKRGKNNKENRE